MDANKLNLFREWLENWKKWKGFKKEGRVELRFPVEEIVKYINAWIELPLVESAIATRHRQCVNRTLFYTHTNQLLKALAPTPLLKYALGTETLGLQGQSYSHALASVSQTKLKELEDVYSLFRGTLKSVENTLSENLPFQLQKL